MVALDFIDADIWFFVYFIYIWFSFVLLLCFEGLLYLYSTQLFCVLCTDDFDVVSIISLSYSIYVVIIDNYDNMRKEFERNA